MTSAGSAKVLDLFERRGDSIGTIERAEAALAAARAMQSPGIIKVEPGSTVKRSQPKGDDSLREATESKAAMVNFAKPLSQRRAAEDATRRAQEEARKAMDPTERLRAINAANSEDAAARARILAENREREARKFQNASSFYGGGGGSSGSAGGSAPAAGSRPPRSRPRSSPVPRAISGSGRRPRIPIALGATIRPTTRPPSRSVRWRRRTLGGWKPPWR